MNRRERRAVARQIIKRRNPNGPGRVSGTFVQRARRDFAAALKVDHADVEAPPQKTRWSRLWTPQDAR